MPGDACSQGSQSRHPYKLEDSPVAVRTADDLALRDAKRSNDLHVNLYYPEGEGRFPCSGAFAARAAKRSSTWPARRRSPSGTPT